MTIVYNKNELPSPAVYYAAAFPDGLSQPTVDGWALVRCVFHADKTASLSINLDHGGYSCFGCGASGGDLIDFERAVNGTTFRQAVEKLSNASYGPCQPKACEPRFKAAASGRADKLEWIWNQARNVSLGDPVDRYLSERGLGMTNYPISLRHCERLDYYNGTERIGSSPVMLARVEDVNGELVTLHRTYIKPSGGKAFGERSKKLMTCVSCKTTRGAAIRLFPCEATLYLAEGIESALAVHRRFEVAVWSTVTAGGMRSIELPPSVETVYLCADNDKSGAGQKAMLDAAARLSKEGRKVFQVLAPIEGVDWCDILRDGK
jgi:putative DNA primase/helicase